MKNKGFLRPMALLGAAALLTGVGVSLAASPASASPDATLTASKTSVAPGWSTVLTATFPRVYANPTVAFIDDDTNTEVCPAIAPDAYASNAQVNCQISFPTGAGVHRISARLTSRNADALYAVETNQVSVAVTADDVKDFGVAGPATVVSSGPVDVTFWTTGLANWVYKGRNDTAPVTTVAPRSTTSTGSGGPGAFTVHVDGPGSYGYLVSSSSCIPNLDCGGINQNVELGFTVVAPAGPTPTAPVVVQKPTTLTLTGPSGVDSGKTATWTATSAPGGSGTVNFYDKVTGSTICANVALVNAVATCSKTLNAGVLVYATSTFACMNYTCGGEANGTTQLVGATSNVVTTGVFGGPTPTFTPKPPVKVTPTPTVTPKVTPTPTPKVTPTPTATPADPWAAFWQSVIDWFNSLMKKR